MFDFKKYFRYVNFSVPTEEQMEAAWDNIAQIEQWAMNELDLISDQYYFLDDLTCVGGQIYIEVDEPPIDFAVDYVDAQ
jgi:hypothetical protein